MRNRVSLDDIPHMPVGATAALPPDQLALLMGEAAEALERAQRIKDRLDGAVDLKYRDRAAAARAAKGKSTGTIRFADGDFIVVAEVGSGAARRGGRDYPPRLAGRSRPVRAYRVQDCRKRVLGLAGGDPPSVRGGAHRRDRQALLPYRARPGGGGMMAIVLDSLRLHDGACRPAHPGPRRRRHRQDHPRRRGAKIGVRLHRRRSRHPGGDALSAGQNLR
jgi:hypothetical protein